MLSSDFIPANQSTSIESSAHYSNLPVTIVSLQSNKKMKHKQKQLLIDKGVWLNGEIKENACMILNKLTLFCIYSSFEYKYYNR